MDAILTYEEQQYFKALIDASIISKSDLEGNITYVNDNFCRISGYSREEIIGKSHSMFRYPGNPDSLYKELWETILAAKVWRGRMINLNKDGSTFIAESTIIPLVDEHGEIKEFMALRSDVTEVVALKRKIFEREHDIEKKKKIEEAKASFLLIFTHELKTPLNAIINFSKYTIKSLAAKGEVNRKKITGLQHSIVQNASDMLENITMILETSKITSHRLNYNRAFFSLDAAVRQTLLKYESLLAESEKKVAVEWPKEEIWVHSDETRVMQVFSNFLTNAIKYGRHKITIKMGKKKGNYLLSVEDDGPGIKDKKAVFDLYHQEEESLTTRSAKGTGIGLYFAKLVCKDLGIAIRLEDAAPDGGSRFSLIFPHPQEAKRKKGA